MAPIRESIAAVFGIVILLAAATWYASDPETQHWPLAAFPAGGASPPPLPDFSVANLDWSADGRLLLSHSHNVVECAESVTLHFLGTGVFQSPVDLAGEAICGAGLAPDGRHLVVGSTSGKLWWIDRESFEAKTFAEMPHGLKLTSVAVANKSSRIVAADVSGTIYVCDPERLTVVAMPSDQPISICDIRFSRDDRRLVTARADGSIVLWDLDSGDRIQSFAGHGKPAQAAAFLPGGERIVSGGLDDSIRIWDIATGREEWRGEFGLNGVRSLDISPDGTTAAWGGFDRKVIVWDLKQRSRKFECRTTAVFVATLKFSPDSRTLAIGGLDRMIRLYDTQTGDELPGIDLAAGTRPDRS